jgi:hypothetical protein
VAAFSIFVKIKVIMTTIIIDEKTKKGKIILDLIRELNAGKIISEKDDNFLPNEQTKRAIEEAKKGNTIRCQDFNDYLEKVK